MARFVCISAFSAPRRLGRALTHVDHNKVITVAAKKALAPLGLRQERKSRIWYDDRGWWAIVVEFQPSSWDRGSYLNVAVSWMLYEHSYWAYDIGGRAEAFRSASEGQDFEGAMNDMAAEAARLVQGYRERFVTLDDMYSHYRMTIEHHGGWEDYYAGVLAGLLRDRSSAEQHFSSVVGGPATTTWHRALQFRCQDLMRLLAEPKFFRESCFGIVLRCRSARNLPEMPIEEIGFP